MNARPVVGVMGLGSMGLGIAQVFVQSGFEALATDTNTQAREMAAARLGQTLAARVSVGKMSEDERSAILARFHVVAEPEAMAKAALIIEAIIEDKLAKQALFARLERVTDHTAVLASNTSSLSITALAQGLARPNRLVGMHFFNPAPVMRLVELVAHDGSDPDAIALARKVAEAAGKVVIECRDRPGFVVNRCARPFYGEALALIGEGRSAREIDAAMLAAGYRIGPLSLIDLIGADVHLAATEGIYSAMGANPRYHVFQPLKDQVADRNLGRKTGKGFVFPDDPGLPPKDAAAIRERIEATMVNEAGWLLAEAGVEQTGIDTAMKLGLNFPRGPFEILQAEGPARILRQLHDLEAVAPPQLKGRYLPCPALKEQA
ncbi:MAG: 3-hydroxybutyryl-CoA dehydrogenase [Cereibacter sphaeroides]|uniref:3-hydroxybutyryl-CoA dehydrogenase n=1 Tax=Cereibacter sphaeroides TaxID=1063 RepID=A0A2W5SKI6_CERSP|nr:MAG: 3-hydroxybutyryl-CoA dehydrogenase [Cereibacter sphaeroides]